MKITVCEFNIEYGGFEKQVEYTKYIEIIIKYDIDILFVMEPFIPKITGNNINYNEYGDNIMVKVAKHINYYHVTKIFDYPITVLSKYILKNVNDIITVNINNKDIILLPIHLNDEPCTFYSLRNIEYDNTPLNVSYEEAALYSFKTKEESINKCVEIIRNNKKYNIILSGDFNEPSHHDDENVKWICSQILEQNGLTDTMLKSNKIYDNYGYNNSQSTCDIDKDNIKCRIDFIYTNMKILNSYRLIEYSNLSDHIPIIAELDI